MYRTPYATVLAVVALCCTITVGAQEVYAQNNAASINQENNSTSGWITSGTQLTSDTTDPYHGFYAIRAEASSTSSNGRRFRYIFPATVGETYDISIWAKQGSQGTSQSFAAWTGVTGFANPTKITSTDWTEYNFTVTATTTNPAIIIYTGSSVQGAVGDVVFIDAISIVPQGTPSGDSGNAVWSETGSVASYTGDVAVGTASVPTGYKMAVDGKLITEEVKVQLSGNWPDYVFTKDYELPSLEEVQRHINEKGHLPNIPSATKVEANGIEVGEMNRLLVEKVEELTLYIMEQNEKSKQMKTDLTNRIEKLEAIIHNNTIPNHEK